MSSIDNGQLIMDNENVGNAALGVPAVDRADCVRCGICLVNCPKEAVDWVKTDGVYWPVVNDKCVGCRKCVDLCPSEAIR